MFLFTFFFFLVFNWLADVRFLAFVFPQEHYKIIIIKNKSPPSNIILPPSWSTLQPLADKHLPSHTHTMYTVQGLKQHVRTDPQSRPKPGFQSTAHHLWDTWKCTKDALGHSLVHIFWMVRVHLYPGRLQCSAAQETESEGSPQPSGWGGRDDCELGPHVQRHMQQEKLAAPICSTLQCTASHFRSVTSNLRIWFL